VVIRRASVILGLIVVFAREGKGREMDMVRGRERKGSDLQVGYLGVSSAVNTWQE